MLSENARFQRRLSRGRSPRRAIVENGRAQSRRPKTVPRPIGERFSPTVSLAAIRRLARKIAKRFQPEKIILFGSRAYGRPDRQSDVDLLVVISARNEMDQAGAIMEAANAPYPIDVIVRTPRNLSWRLRQGDWFLREITHKGKTLYEKSDKGVAR